MTHATLEHIKIKTIAAILLPDIKILQLMARFEPSLSFILSQPRAEDQVRPSKPYYILMGAFGSICIFTILSANYHGPGADMPFGNQAVFDIWIILGKILGDLRSIAFKEKDRAIGGIGKRSGHKKLSLFIEALAYFR
jgi:hypothetical protein